MFDRFVGIPYADKGRETSAVDCWGLLCLAFRELRGIELPSYSERYVTAADRRAVAALIGDELDPWLPVVPGSEQPFDAVLMRDGRFIRHVGLVTLPGQLLHVEQDRTSVIERYRSGLLQARVVGFYRYQ